MSELSINYVPLTKVEELKLKKEKLQQLLETAEGMTSTIEAEDKGQTPEELSDHHDWINQLKQQIKDIDKLL